MSLVDQAKAAGLSEDEIQALKDAEAEQSMNAADLQNIANNGETTAAAPATEGAAAAAPTAAAVTEGAAAAEAPAAGAEGAPAAAAPAGEAAAALAAAAVVEQPAAATREMPFAPTLRSEAPVDNAARLKEISVEKAKVLKDFVDGVIDAEQYAATDERLTTDRDVIVSGQTKAQLTAEHNEQIYNSLFEHELKRFLRSSKEIDYSKPEDRARFDRAFSLIAQDPENAGKDFDQLEDIFTQADSMVRAMKGVKAPAAPAAPAPAAAASAAPAAAAPAAPALRQVPNTLATLPAAAPATLDNDPLTKAASLEGEELERYVAGMSKGDHENLMRRATQ